MTAIAAFKAAMSRQIKPSWFYHFTARSNLESIREHGLLSKSAMDRLGLAYQPSGSPQSRESDRMSGVADFVSLSFTADHPMRDAVRLSGRAEAVTTLRIHPGILCFEGIVFCPQMANVKGAGFFDLEEAIRAEMIDFETLYDDTVPADPGRLDRAARGELLIPNCVPPVFLA